MWKANCGYAGCSIKERSTRRSSSLCSSVSGGNGQPLMERNDFPFIGRIFLRPVHFTSMTFTRCSQKRILLDYAHVYNSSLRGHTSSDYTNVTSQPQSSNRYLQRGSKTHSILSTTLSKSTILILRQSPRFKKSRNIHFEFILSQVVQLPNGLLTLSITMPSNKRTLTWLHKRN